MYVNFYKKTPDGVTNKTDCNVKECPQREQFALQVTEILGRANGMTVEGRAIVECKKSPGFKCVNHFDNKP